MKLKHADVGDEVLLPIVVKRDAGDAVLVEFNEGDGSGGFMALSGETKVYPVAHTEAARPIEIDDIVFVAFEDGKWRVADRFNDQLFLTPHMDVAEALSDHPRTAMLADAEDCYHVSPKGGW